MKLKDGVDIRFLRQEIVRYLPNIEAIFNWHASHPDFEFVITAGCDGKHSDHSKHYVNLAIDCRIWHLTNEEIDYIVIDLQELNPDFDVVREPTHVHLEVDL